MPPITYRILKLVFKIRKEMLVTHWPVFSPNEMRSEHITYASNKSDMPMLQTNTRLHTFDINSFSKYQTVNIESIPEEQEWTRIRFLWVTNHIEQYESHLQGAYKTDSCIKKQPMRIASPANTYSFSPWVIMIIYYTFSPVIRRH